MHILFSIVAFVVGCTVAWTLTPNRHVAWRIGMGIYFGLISPALSLYLLQKLNFDFAIKNMFSVLSVLGSTVLIITFVVHKLGGLDNRRSLPENRGSPLLFWFGALGATGFLLLVANGVTTPLFAWDGWEYWVLRSKFLFASNGLRDYERPFTELYPPLVPLLVVAASMPFGEITISMVTVIFLGLFIAMLTSMYGFLRDAGLVRSPAILSVYLSGSIPLLSVHTTMAGYADLPQAVATFFAACAAFYFVRRPNIANFLMLSSLVALLPLIKVPGLLWAFVIMFSVWLSFACKKSGKLFWKISVSMGVCLAIFLFYEANRRGFAYSLYGISKVLNDDWQSIFSLVKFSSFSLVFVLISVASVLFFIQCLVKRNANKVAPYFFAVISPVILISIVTFTNSEEYWRDSATVGRAILHITPSVLALFIVFMNDEYFVNRNGSG